MRNRSSILIALLLALAPGCADSSNGAPRARAEEPEYFLEPCDPGLSDSARVECNALAAVVKDDGFPSQVFEFRRVGTGYCVTTYPSHSSVVDGGAVVMLDSAGVVRSVVKGDSVGCPRPPA